MDSFFCDSDLQETDLSRLLVNTTGVFLVCGGPSLLDNHLALLNKRGVFSMAVNNAAALWQFRPSAFIHADPPLKFHDAIWHDPGIMKFTPKPKLAKRGRLVLRHRRPDGTFFKGGNVRDCPNVWGYERRTWLLPDDSFFESEASWGNLRAGSERTGQPKTACTMLAAIRVLYELGARKIYLLGCDFDMRLRPYAFEQKKDADGIESNNRQFQIVNSWLCEMQTRGVFERAGLSLLNCNKNSGLKAFPYRSFEDAVIDSRQTMPSEINLEDWYEKGSD